MPRITASLVVYKSPPAELEALFAALNECADVIAWVAVDNAAMESPAQAGPLREAVERSGGLYVAAPRNLGFGAGHNLAMRALSEHSSEFHLMVNPDILFGLDALPALAAVLEARPDVALVMPRILYPDGTDQYLCKLLPTPLDFALRRFAPRFVQRLAQQRMDRYELRGLETTACTCVPFLSGCFMFTRRAMLEQTGGFDDRYFLYLEDVDLCRRLAAVGSLLYWPAVSVTHGYHRGAHRNFALMMTFLRSAVRYFNQWGWFFDRRRAVANRTAIQQLEEARRRIS